MTPKDGTVPPEPAADQQRPYLGTLIRPRPLTIHDLPKPPKSAEISPGGGAAGLQEEAGDDNGLGDDETANQYRPDLVKFIETVLLEGYQFVGGKESFMVTGSKTVRPAVEKVEKLKRIVRKEELDELDWKGSLCRSRSVFKWKKEVWYGRRSTHSVKHEKYGATWDSFVDNLLRNHSEKQADYVPGIYDCRVVTDWESAIHSPAARFDDRFSEVSMRIVEMCHEFAVGSSRHFSTVVVSGKVDPSVFIIVQIPVNITKGVPGAFYSSRRNTAHGQTPKQRKETVEGQYVSVECCSHDLSQDRVTWIMCSCSDAKGYFPLWLQRLAAPGMIVKNVGYFFDWIRKN